MRDSRCQGQFQDKVFMLKMYVGLVRSGFNAVKHMERRGDMENS